MGPRRNKELIIALENVRDQLDSETYSVARHHLWDAMHAIQSASKETPLLDATDLIEHPKAWAGWLQ